MNILFERLSLQGHLRRILDRSPDQGWEIIRRAIERELNHQVIKHQPSRDPTVNTR